jgi:hexosaminidase
VLVAVAVLAVAGAQTPPVPIIPRPRSAEPADGVFVLEGPVRIAVPPGDSGLLEAARLLAEWLERSAGLTVAASTAAAPAAAIIFERAAAGEAGFSNPEAYGLTVSPSGIRIRASGDAGACWAVQSLRQLLPPEIERGTRRLQLRVPAVRITDAPRFAWRGSLVDVGRHYLPPAVIKRHIDLLALHKLNVLHWHLTEDQGWRVEIRRHPRLTAVGAWRTEADGVRYGGFYTREEVREIVEYARRRHVAVVPEIEMPGHASAALAAYPEYSCTGETKAVPTTWGVFEDVFCPGQEKTFAFLQDVLDEVMELFPSRVLHVGGDEVPKAHWKACARCQARMKAEGLKSEDELQSYVIRRIGDYVRSRGREIIGWDEILEGGLPPGTSVQVWRDAEHTRTAIRLGARVVASPNSHTYINRSPAELPLARVLTFDPVPRGLSAEEAALVLGGEATLWSEGIDEANFDAMAFPRLAAFAEAVWSPPPAGWTDFRSRLAVNGYPRLAAMGVNYGPEDRPLVSFRPAFDPADGRVALRAEHHVRPLEFRVTTDGSVPTLQSPRFDAATRFATTGTVRVQPFLNGLPMLQSARLTIDRHLAVARPVACAAPHSPKYPGTGPYALTDSLRGSPDFSDGTWQGWEGEAMEGVIDLGAATPLSEVEVGTLQVMRSWILLPRRVGIWLSDDGVAWKTAADLTHDVPAERADPLIHRFRQPLPAGTRARYVKVRAVNAGPLPSWHPGAGAKAWVFVDEIAIR